MKQGKTPDCSPPASFSKGCTLAKKHLHHWMGAKYRRENDGTEMS